MISNDPPKNPPFVHRGGGGDPAPARLGTTDWTEKFLTYEGWGFWTAWDETQANSIGTFFMKWRAKRELLKYAAWLCAELDNPALATWLKKCAARFQERAGVSEKEARSLAKSQLENLKGDLTEDPVDAADDEMSCWTD